jgi:hypothetical protein
MTLRLGNNAKIINSVDKLFQLGEGLPVGVMIYSSPSILSVPWETVISEYRSRATNKRQDTLEDYATDFFRFVQRNRVLFPAQSQEAHILQNATLFCEHLKSLMQVSVFESFAHGNNSRSKNPDIPALLKEALIEMDNIAKQSSAVGKTPRDFKKKLKDRYSKKIEEIQKATLDGIPLNAKIRRKITSLYLELLLGSGFGGPATGIVFAGFGEKDTYPALLEYRAQGVVQNRLIHGLEQRAEVGKQASSFVIPFAQQGEVATFMDGISPDLKSEIAKILPGLCEHVAVHALKSPSGRAASKARQKRAREFASRCSDAALQSLENKIANTSSSSVMVMVDSLPKTELAYTAEALVNLTKFKRKISNQLETVGGPVDVAVITKGNGFEWIKNKHLSRNGQSAIGVPG